MKKNALKVLSSAVVVTSLLTSSVFAAESSATSVSNQKNQAIKSNTSEGIITPDTYGNKWSGTASGSNIFSGSFVVPINYGHVKLWFSNKGASSVTISVTHNDTGKIYFTQTVAAGQQFTWRSINDYPQGMRSGSYTISYHSASANVNVDFSGFASDNVNEVKN